LFRVWLCHLLTIYRENYPLWPLFAGLPFADAFILSRILAASSYLSSFTANASWFCKSLSFCSFILFFVFLIAQPVTSVSAFCSSCDSELYGRFPLDIKICNSQNLQKPVNLAKGTKSWYKKLKKFC